MRRIGRRHIGQMTDVAVVLRCHDRRVVIIIRLDAIDPPAGRVSLPGDPEHPFMGWLGLLAVLSELLGP